MKRALSLACMFLVSLAVSAQKIDNFKYKLSQPDSTCRATVTVTENPGAAEAVRIAQNMRQEDRIKGYRVGIFFDNSQSARQRANEILARFKEEHPGVAAYLTYENPNFKVTVGNCVTVEEATILWGNVKGSFDRAIVVSGVDIPIGALTE